MLLFDTIRALRLVSSASDARVLELLDESSVSNRATASRRAVRLTFCAALILCPRKASSMRCFDRSATLCLVMRDCGHKAYVAFGLPLGGGLSNGHCWITFDPSPAGHDSGQTAVMILPRH